MADKILILILKIVYYILATVLVIYHHPFFATYCFFAGLFAMTDEEYKDFKKKHNM